MSHFDFLINLVGPVRLELTDAFGVGFTVRWGYQFSYVPVVILKVLARVIETR